MGSVDALCRDCGKPIRWIPGNIMSCVPCWEKRKALIRANETNQRVLRMVKELSRSA